MKKIALLSILIAYTSALLAQDNGQIDTLISVNQVSISTIKQGLNLYRQPVSATILSSKEVERRDIKEIKDISISIPNMHIPDYGSRTTSSIYVRGLGARIDQPVMGLNVDNVPYINKNGFDTQVIDIARVEVLRGPQSTLYGRNTMGGVMNIYTLSPFDYQGIKLGAEYSSGNTYKLRASIYNLHSEKLATTLSANYASSDGLFENAYSGELCDWEKSAGVRLKVAYKDSKNLRIDNTTAAYMLQQGGYPYRLIDHEDVNYNTPSSYDRITANNGTTVKYQGDNYSIASISSYQYLNDDMFLDNDFTQCDYFTLQQAIKEHSFTEDVVYKTEHDSPYNMLFGAFGFYKHQSMRAPVTFKEYGINELILAHANKYLAPQYFKWDEDEFCLNSDFINITYGAALYHESTFESGRWLATAGIRLDYEKAALTYHNYTSSSCTMYNKDGVALTTLPIDINTVDKVPLSFLELLPKASIQYRLGQYSQSSLYISASKGYKAGGFNTQIFSDILQEQVKEEGFNIPSTSTYDTKDIITYKPEHSWNFEVGSHIESANRAIVANIALFYINCFDQQLTVFPKGQSTGRMMTNAGRSRSFGAEVSLVSKITDCLHVNASYGYTNAKFEEYVSGDENYASNYVPYAPQHTIFAEVSYTKPIDSKWAEAIGFDINSTGAGKIYWNEDNTQSQPLYALLGAALRVEHSRYAVTLWAKNILQTEYNTFYFKSMEREFVQSARPRTIGITLNINI